MPPRACASSSGSGCHRRLHSRAGSESVLAEHGQRLSASETVPSGPLSKFGERFEARYEISIHERSSRRSKVAHGPALRRRLRPHRIRDRATDPMNRRSHIDRLTSLRSSRTSETDETGVEGRSCRERHGLPLVRFRQLRGTSAHGRSRSTRMSPGNPSTRSPRMFFITSVVPPSIELARLRRNAFCSVSEPIAVSGRIIS